MIVFHARSTSWQSMNRRHLTLLQSLLTKFILTIPKSKLSIFSIIGIVTLRLLTDEHAGDGEEDYEEDDEDYNEGDEDDYMMCPTECIQYAQRRQASYHQDPQYRNAQVNYFDY